jgi:hypothetical protein
MVLGALAAKIAKKGGKPPDKQTLYVAIGTLLCAQVGWFTYRVSTGSTAPVADNGKEVELPSVASRSFSDVMFAHLTTLDDL